MSPLKRSNVLGAKGSSRYILCHVGKSLTSNLLWFLWKELFEEKQCRVE